MQPDRSRSEVETLRDLLTDFAADGWGPERAEEAFDHVADRYEVVKDLYVIVADAVSAAVGSGASLADACQTVLIEMHRRLFDGILTSAGRTRLASDAGGSDVYFGGPKGQRREMRFTGTPAERIEEELDAAFARLQDHRGKPGGRDRARDEAVRFYADLSRIHPFYDANGRTGRFVVSVYLHLHGWLVEWGRLETKDTEFLRRINNVNEKATAQTDYDRFLVSFWRRYVVPTEGLE